MAASFIRVERFTDSDGRGLQDGSSRVFGAGEHFHCADRLPQGASFDAKVHGHWSRQVGDEPLVRLFVRS